MENYRHILDQLPYRKPFLFVDELLRIDAEGVEGSYTFRRDEYFYRGHFKNGAVTPGVILTEVMAQIGLVCLGIYLLQSEKREKTGIAGEEAVLAFTESDVVFERTVYPGEKVKVIAQKIYWRLGKLKCRVGLFNEEGKKVCHGELAGIIVK